MVFGKLRKKVEKIQDKRADAQQLKEEMQKIEDEAYKEALLVESTKQARARGKAKALAKAKKAGESRLGFFKAAAVGFRKIQRTAAKLQEAGVGQVDLFGTEGFGTADLLGMKQKKRGKKKKTRKQRKTRL